MNHSKIYKQLPIRMPFGNEQGENEVLDMDFLYSDDKSLVANNEDDLETTQRDPDFYGPSLKNDKVKDGTYQSTVRLVPKLRPSTPYAIMKVWGYYLPDVDSTNGGNYYVTCTSNVSKLSKNIISEAYFAMKDHQVAKFRESAKKFFMRKTFYYSLVYIIEDEQLPEDVGKIKIMRFGNQINDMIIKQEEIVKGKTPCTVNSFRSGKDLYIRISEKTVDNGRKITSYEDSYFADTITPFMGKIPSEMTSEEKSKLEELFKTAPDLYEKTSHKEWSPDLEKKVIRTVRAVIDDDRFFGDLYKKIYKKPFDFTEEGAKFSTTSDDSPGVEQGIASSQEFVSIDELSSHIQQPTKKEPEQVVATTMQNVQSATQSPANATKKIPPIEIVDTKSSDVEIPVTDDFSDIDLTDID